jgi:hypothetical protein
LTGDERLRRLRREIAAVIGGWSALTAAVVAWFWFAEDNEARTPYWGAVTAAITVTITGVIALMVADRVLARRDGVDVAGRGHLVGLALAGIAWPTGGLLSLFYLGSIGGPAARLAQDCIKKVEILEYPELGMEAVWKIEVVDFPAFIVVDDKGNDFFDTRQQDAGATFVGIPLRNNR